MLYSIDGAYHVSNGLYIILYQLQDQDAARSGWILLAGETSLYDAPVNWRHFLHANFC